MWRPWIKDLEKMLDKQDSDMNSNEGVPGLSSDKEDSDTSFNERGIKRDGQ